MNRVIILAACSVAFLFGSATAQAATKNGITPTAPKRGSTVPVGTAPTFKGKVKGEGTVWIHVCKKRRTNGDGVLYRKAMIDRAKKQDGRFKLKAEFFDFPAFWLNTPGAYYWQAHRIACEGDLGDCRQEGPIVKFKVG
jgi:hypothetical protein